MVGWHHRLDGHEFEQVPGVGDGQGSLACCSPWGCTILLCQLGLCWALSIGALDGEPKLAGRRGKSPFPPMRA